MTAKIGELSDELGGETPSSPTETKDCSASILVGMEAAVCAVLGIRDLRHRSALTELSRRDQLPHGAVFESFQNLSRNMQRHQTAMGGGRSLQNWRWRAPQLGIAERNHSAEVLLERALVNFCESNGHRDWANQVPVASGIAGPTKDRRRAIDLVHQLAPGHFELIELKIASDTPLYAAFEIIGYCCIWLLARQHPDRVANALLDADRIDAVVWAPAAFYARYKLSKLTELLNSELSALGDQQGAKLSFRFDMFPDALAGAPYDDKTLRAMLAERRSL